MMTRIHLLFCSVLLCFSFAAEVSAQADEACTGQERADIEKRLMNACVKAGMARSGDDDISECRNEADHCYLARENSNTSCGDAEVKKVCGATREELSDLRDKYEKRIDRLSQSATRQKSNEADKTAQALDALKERSKADTDLAQEKIRIQERQLEDQSKHTQEVNDIRRRISDRLKDVTDQDIALGDAEISLFREKMNAAKAVRDAIIERETRCREVQREYLRTLNAQIQVAKQSSDARVVGTVVAKNINAALALDKNIQAQLNDRLIQCREDLQLSIDEVKNAQAEVDNLVDQRSQQIQKSRLALLKHKQDSDQNDQNELNSKAQDLINKEGARTQQLQAAEQAAASAKQNADIALAVALGQAGPEGNPSQESVTVDAQERVDKAQLCLEDLEEVRPKQNFEAFKKVVEIHAEHKGCETFNNDSGRVTASDGEIRDF